MHTKWLFAFCLIAYNFSALAAPTAFPTMKQQNSNWKQDMNDRANELQNLQQQNGYGGEHLTKTDFPTTYADVPFAQRIENEKAGLEPFKDKKAYMELKVKTAEEWCNEHSDDSLCKKEKPKKPEGPKQPEQPETTTVCKTKFGDLNVGKGFKKKSLSDCDGIEKTESDNSLVKSWEIICRDGGKLVCKPYECKDSVNYKVDIKNGKCIVVINPNLIGAKAEYSETTWSVDFNYYGLVKGIAMCSDEKNSQYGTGTPTQSETGKYCWCKVTSIGDNNVSESDWVYAQRRNLLGTNEEFKDCHDKCANYCSKKVRDDTYFRKALYGPLAQ